MLSILTNTPSLSAQRTLQKNGAQLSQSFQRLSTGLRITSAKDDAAGLAISNRMTAQVRGLNQAVRNASDATSLAQTAEAALSEQMSMLQRLRELAVQSANDTNTAQDRAAIQLEADQLTAEIERIAVQTQFNGKVLLDGTFSSARFQVGAFANQTIDVSLSSSRTSALGRVYETTTTAVTADAIATLTLNGVAVRASVAGDDTFSSAGNAGSAIAKAAAINDSSASHGVTARANATVLTGAAVISAGTTGATFAINGVTIGAVAVDALDAGGSLQAAINAVSGQTGVTADLSAGALRLTAADGRNIVVANSDGVDGAGAGTTYATLSLKSDEIFHVGGAGVGGFASVGVAAAGVQNTLRATNGSNLNFGTQAGASTAMTVLDDAISQVASKQAELGAVLNRMDAAVSQLSAASENIAAARGRIQDADFAAETAHFSKNQILQQASTAMLAQANVANQIALQLLG